MTPPALLASLRAAGLSLRAEGGKLLIRPISRLTAEQRAAVAASRDALLSLLSPDSAAWEEAASAIAERAFLDPPDFGGAGVAMRESVVVRLEGFPAVAVSPEEWAEIEKVNADARKARERLAALAAAKGWARRKPAGDLFGTSKDHERR